uniref:Uncharacterized protein n=1 Tax=Anguilla anguilla TaxID=7936 RepID=A0A0E9VWR7_ANGAN
MVTTPMLWSCPVSKNENNPSEMSTVANDALKCVQKTQPRVKSKAVFFVF